MFNGINGRTKIPILEYKLSLESKSLDGKIFSITIILARNYNFYNIFFINLILHLSL